VAALGLGQLSEAAVDFGAELQELLAVGNELLAMGDELLTVSGEFLGQAPEAFLRAALGLGQLSEAAVGLGPMGDELLVVLPLGAVEGQDEAGGPLKAPLHPLGHPPHFFGGQQGPQGLPPLRMRPQQLRQIPQIFHREGHRAPP
jgi:hypothetical protein